MENKNGLSKYAKFENAELLIHLYRGFYQEEDRIRIAIESLGFDADRFSLSPIEELYNLIEESLMDYFPVEVKNEPLNDAEMNRNGYFTMEHIISNQVSFMDYTDPSISPSEFIAQFKERFKDRV